MGLAVDLLSPLAKGNIWKRKLLGRLLGSKSNLVSVLTVNIYALKKIVMSQTVSMMTPLTDFRVSVILLCTCGRNESKTTHVRPKKEPQLQAG